MDESDRSQKQLLKEIKKLKSVIIKLEKSEEKSKSSKKKLKISEENFHSLLKALPVPTYTWKWNGDDFILKNYNKTAEAFTSGKIVTLLGVKARDLYKNEPAILKEFDTCFKTESTIKREMNYRLKSTGINKYLDTTYSFVPPNMVMVYTEDFTKQKQTEDALCDAYNIINRSPSVAFLWKNKENWPVEFVSENVKKLTGYSVEDFLSEKIRYNQLIFPEDQVRVKFEVRENSSKPIKLSFLHLPYRIITKNGEIKWVEDVTYIRKNNQNIITHYEGIVCDISRRMENEKALKDNELKLRLLADYTYDWEYWIDTNRNYIYQSPSCKRITGYIPEDFTINPNLLFEIVKPEYKEIVYKHYHDEENEETPFFSMEIPIITKIGEERWIEHNCSPVYDDNNKFLGRRGNNRDITKRKETENKLKSLSELYENIVEASTVGISIYNSIGKCIAANDAAGKAVGATKEQLLEQNYHEVDSWKKSGLYDIFLDSLKENTKNRLQITITTTFGKNCTLDIHIIPLIINKESHLLIMFEDISLIKQAEDELIEHRENLEKLVMERTKELNEKNEELQKFNDLFVDREFRIKELRDRVKVLEGKNSN